MKEARHGSLHGRAGKRNVPQRDARLVACCTALNLHPPFCNTQAMHFISPVQGFKFYGVTDADALSLATLRNAGAWELGLAALFIMDPATVVARSNFVAGLSLLSYGPAYAEISGSPKEK